MKATHVVFTNHERVLTAQTATQMYFMPLLIGWFFFGFTCHRALVFAQQKSLGSPSIRAPYIKQKKINMHPFSWAERAPLLDHGMVTRGACRRAGQDARTNSRQSQVTVRLICGEPYFPCLPKDPAGQCALSLAPDKPHLPHTQNLYRVSHPGYKLRGLRCPRTATVTAVLATGKTTVVFVS